MFYTSRKTNAQEKHENLTKIHTKYDLQNEYQTNSEREIYEFVKY